MNTERNGITKRIRGLIAITFLAAGVLAAPAFAQTRGILGYDSNTDSGYVRLFGTTGSSASRLWVAGGGDDDRGILQLYDAGQQRALLYADPASQGTLALFGSGGSQAVRLYIDDGTNHGGMGVAEDGGNFRGRLFVDSVGQGTLSLNGTGGDEILRLWASDSSDNGHLTISAADAGARAELFVDADDRGQLVLREADGSQASRLDVGNQGGGRLRAFDSAGSERATFGVDAFGAAGNLRLLNAQGRTVATLASSLFSHNGFLTLRDDSAGFTTRVTLWVDGQDQGDLILRGTAGLEAVRLGIDDAIDHGVLRLAGSGGQPRAQLWVDAQDQGELRLDAADGTRAAGLFVSDATGNGWLELAEAAGSPRAVLRVDGENQGELVLVGAGGSERARLSVRDGDDSGLLRLIGEDGGNIVTATAASPDASNHGRVRVYGGSDGVTGQLRGELEADPVSDGGRLELRNAAGTPTIVLDGATGVITKAGLNGFCVPHPADDRMEILYGSLEGPEAGMYVRGSARVEGGRAVVTLPEHFAALARPGTLTVQLTPGSAETYGLAAVEKTPQKIVVAELGGGTGDFGFDYVVFAERADLEPLQVVRPRPAGVSPTPAGDVLDLAGLAAHRGTQRVELGEDNTSKVLAQLEAAAPEAEETGETEVETGVSGGSEREEPDRKLSDESGEEKKQ